MTNKDKIKELDAQWRALHKDLFDRCYGGTDNFEWSRISKLPLKVVNVLQPMTWRMRDTEEAARILIDKNHIHPAAILIRSAMENTAFLHVLCNIVEDVVVAGKVLDDTDKKLMDMSFGNKYRKGEYIADEVYESMHEHKALRSGEIMDEIDKRYPSYYSMYRSLCEFVHTNTDGVQGCYSKLDIENHTTSYGKLLTKESVFFPAIESSIVLALSIYKERYDAITQNLTKFIEICEKDIIDRNKSI